MTVHGTVAIASGPVARSGRRMRADDNWLEAGPVHGAMVGERGARIGKPRGGARRAERWGVERAQGRVLAAPVLAQPHAMRLALFLAALIAACGIPSVAEAILLVHGDDLRPALVAIGLTGWVGYVAGDLVSAFVWRAGAVGAASGLDGVALTEPRRSRRQALAAWVEGLSHIRRRPLEAAIALFACPLQSPDSETRT